MVSISAADGLSQQKSIQKKTRNTAKIFGLGDAISIVDAEITGSHLPTCRQVIRCYMYIQKNIRPVNISAKLNIKWQKLYLEK